MDKHISALGDASQSYDKVLDAVLAEIESTNLHFMLNIAALLDAHECFLSTSKDAREYMQQQVALQLEALDLTAAEPPLVREEDNGVSEEQDTSLSHVLAVLHLCNAELEKLLQYHKDIPDPEKEELELGTSERI